MQLNVPDGCDVFENEVTHMTAGEIILDLSEPAGSISMSLATFLTRASEPSQVLGSDMPATREVATRRRGGRRMV